MFGLPVPARIQSAFRIPHSAFLFGLSSLFILCLALGGCKPAHQAALTRAPKVLWSRGTGLTDPDPVAADLNLDRRLEILMVGANNNVAAVGADNGRVLWRHKLGSTPLLTPVAGHFLGNNRINVVVPTANGELYVLDGATGKYIDDTSYLYHSGILALSLPPTVFPWIHGENEYQPYQEGILLYAPGNKLYGYLIRPHGLLELAFEYKVDGLLQTPPVSGKTGLNAPEPHISYVNYAGDVTVFSGRQPNLKATSNAITFSGQCQKGVSLGNLTKAPAGDLVIADKNGYLHALDVKNGGLNTVWSENTPSSGTVPVERRSIQKEPLSCPVLIDVTGDHIDDILVPREDGYSLIDGATGLALWNTDYLHDRGIESPPAVFHAKDGQAYAVFCDQINVCLMNLRQCAVTARINLERAGKNATPVVAPFGDGDAAEAYIVNSIDGTGTMIDLGVDFQPQAPPYFGRNGGPNRTSAEPREYQAFRLAQLDKLSKTMDEMLLTAQNLAKAGNWPMALKQVEEVLASNPSHREAQKLHFRYFIRNNIIGIGVTAALAIGLLGYLGWLTYRFTRRVFDYRRARRALAAEDQERAIYLLYNLCIKFPRNKGYVAELSDLYISQKQFNTHSAGIFDRARRFFPAEERYLKALATALSSIPRHDEAAAAVYIEMARISKKPGPWYFILGQTLQQLGRPREALEAFRQAMANGREDPRLPQYLTDLYVLLGIHSSDILPTLELVLEQRKGDRAFLRTYCQACQEARRYDEQAQQMATLLLELDPAAPPAHIILATSYLQAGRHKDAMLHSQNVLQVNPNDSIGLRLLGACYAAERRLDATAMEIFARALQSNPDAPEILIAVSHGYIQDDRQDTNACDIYKKALVHNPQDESILGQLARIAGRDNDDDLTIRAIEPLLAMGKHNRDLVMQLANAYCRQGIIENKAEAIYREALVHQPDHATIQDNLAAIFLRKSRVDAEAAQLYEAIRLRHPERFDVGMQLMRCYQVMELPEKALDLGRTLSALEPENNDLKKLMAMASEKADQMESAILGYEQVLAGYPADKEALCALSSLYGRKRRNDNHAIEVYNQAIQIEPRRPDHYLAATRAYAARESWDHAIQIIRHLLTQAPGQIAAAISLMEGLLESAPKIHKMRSFLIETLIFEGRLRDARAQVLAMLKIDAGQAQPALALLDKILEKNPKDALAHLERGRLLMAQGREQDARYALEEAHRYHPENDEISRTLLAFYQRLIEKRDAPEVRFQLGRLAMRLDKHDLAISCFQVTRKDYRWEGESIRNLARCFMAKGMLDLALQELKKPPMEDDLKELLYELGQRYEAVHDIMGARETYKVIFASDITYKDVKGKLETLAEAGDHLNAERTNIINSLSEEAKRRYELVQELGPRGNGHRLQSQGQRVGRVRGAQDPARQHDQKRRGGAPLQNRGAQRPPPGPPPHRAHPRHRRGSRPQIYFHGIRQGRRPQAEDPPDQESPPALPLGAALRAPDLRGDGLRPFDRHRAPRPQARQPDADRGRLRQGHRLRHRQAGRVHGRAGIDPGRRDHRHPRFTCLPSRSRASRSITAPTSTRWAPCSTSLAPAGPPSPRGDLAYQHLFVEPKPLKDVPPSYAKIVLKCLAKDKEQRWQSAKEILDALNTVKDDEPVAD